MPDDEIDDEERVLELVSDAIDGRISRAQFEAMARTVPPAVWRRGAGLDDEAERARLGLPPIDTARLH